MFDWAKLISKAMLFGLLGAVLLILLTGCAQIQYWRCEQVADGRDFRLLMGRSDAEGFIDSCEVRPPSGGQA